MMQSEHFESDTVLSNSNPLQEPQESTEQIAQSRPVMLTQRGMPMRRSARAVSGRVASILSWEGASENTQSFRVVADSFENDFKNEADNKKRRVTYQAPDSDSEVEFGDTDDDEADSSSIDSGSEDCDFTEPSRGAESDSDAHSGITDSRDDSMDSCSESGNLNTHQSLSESDYVEIDNSETDVAESQGENTDLHSDTADYIEQDSCLYGAESHTDNTQMSHEIPDLVRQTGDFVDICLRTDLDDIGMLTDLDDMAVHHFFNKPSHLTVPNS